MLWKCDQLSLVAVLVSTHLLASRRTGREAKDTGPPVGCQVKLTKGRDYEGQASITVDGEVCQPWPATDYPELGGHNYCRNPNPEGHEGGVWCFAGDDYFGYCKVPWCDQRIPPVRVLDFSGDNDGAPDSNGSFTHASLERPGLPRSFTLCTAFMVEAWTSANADAILFLMREDDGGDSGHCAPHLWRLLCRSWLLLL